ncbi:MAG TPA: uracil-DNA glycosylase, partial [Thermoanaerobaculia bacterium]
MNPDVLRELALLRDFGYTHLDLTTSAAPTPTNHQPPTTDSPSSFDDLRLETHNCTACRLAGTRTNVVFGVGNPNADLMFVGEAPGRDEDLQGEPFVGRAGQLLTDIIKAMKLTRDEVYIA